MVLFTGLLPASLASFQAMYLRYTLRTATSGFLREEYPPFSFTTTPADPAGDDRRVGVELVPQLEGRDRWTVGFRLDLVIPQLIVLALLGISAVESRPGRVNHRRR